MPIEIDIPPELEHQLQQAAHQAGVEPSIYIIRLLQQNLRQDKLPKIESELLQQIDRSFSKIDWQRYDKLIEKRQNETLTPDEQNELISLSDCIESLNVDRIQNLAKLALIRKITINDLMIELGIKLITHA